MICLLLFEKIRKEREREIRPWDFFSPGKIHSIGCAKPRFSQQLGAIKSCFKSQSLNFMCT
jgi:hypothetical protein